MVEGLSTPFRALGLILRRPKLLALSSAPVVLSIVVSALLLGWLKTVATNAALHWLAAHGYEAGALTTKIAVFVLAALVWLLGIVLFSTTVGILASPFNDFLAEAAEKDCRPALSEPPPESKTWKGRIEILGIDLTKTIAVLALQMALLGVSLVTFWIPGLAFLWTAAAFLLLTYQYIAYPQTRRAQGLFESARFLVRYPWLSLGFGGALAVLFSIPFVSALTIPLAVVGGTLLYSRQFRTRQFRTR